MRNINWVKEEFKNMQIDDGRIIKRVIKTVESLVSSPGKSIPQACKEWANTKGAYRLFKSTKLTTQKILEAHKKKTIKRVAGQKIILNAQDTSELDYNTLVCTKGLGPYGCKEKSRGLIMHSSMAISTEGVPLGLLGQKIWARDPEKRGKSKESRKYPIEQKESYKWLTSADTARVGIPDDVKVVDVCDRDADLYEFLYKGVTEKKSFVVRAKHDRLIKDTDKKLYKRLENLSAAGEAIIEIPRDSRSKLPARKGRFCVKFGSATIAAPPYLPEKYRDAGSLTLKIIMIEEIDPPRNKKPIKWILFTDMDVTTLDEALEKIKWYKHRWKIERFHYVLKSGCNIEKFQFETANNLIKAISLSSIIAWKILWLAYESREAPDESCEGILSSKEWKVLDCIVNKKTTPRHKPLSLKEAALLIAKLGGFLARKGDGDPGVKVLWRGLRELDIIMENLEIIRNIQEV